MINFGRRRPLWAVFFIVLTLAVAMAAAAAQAGDTGKANELVKQGLELFRAKNYKAALERFTAASDAAPSHKGAMLMRGMMSNRLGDFREAQKSLIAAKTLGITLPRLDFETAWSLIGLRLWGMALPLLQKYEEAKPGNAKVSEFQGRAYLAMGKLDLAEGKLKEALARNPKAKATPNYYLGFLENKRGNRAAAGDYLKVLLAEAPDSPLAKTLNKELAKMAAAQPSRKPWQVGGSMAWGYNDNVLLLSGPLSMPTDVTSTESHFMEYSAFARNSWRLAERQRLVAGYALSGTDYNNVDSADTNSHLLFYDYTYALAPDLVAGGKVNLSSTIIDGNTFSGRADLGPSLSYRVDKHLNLKADYTLAFTNFDNDPTPARDRDSESHTLGFSMFVKPPIYKILKPRFSFGFSRTWNRAEGDDYDYDSNRFFSTAALSLPWDVSMNGSVSFTSSDYDNDNTYGAVGSPRKDNQFTGNVRFSRPVYDKWEWLDGFVQYRHMQNYSNITFFEYTQSSWRLGLSAKY